MCRMIAFASAEPRAIAPYLAHLARLSARGNLVAGWERRAGGNHPDGWGVAYRGGATTSVLRSGQPAAADPLLREVGAAATQFIGHARYASRPDTVGPENSHPFLSGDIVVAHNGTFRGRIGSEADARGVSDTLVFAELLAESWTDRTPAGLGATLSRLLGDAGLVGDYSAANLLIGSGDRLFALRKFRRNPDYYTLHVRSEEGLSVAASQPLDDGPGWRLLSDGELAELSGAGPRSFRLER